MTEAVFAYRDYKKFLTDWVDRRGRGEKSRIAQVLRCHVAYISQVLNQDAELSLEQADALNHHLGHSGEEADFFLLLVSLGRAGSASLRKHFEEKISRVLYERAQLEGRLKDKRTLAAEGQATYYSAWYYSAIHLLISIPAFQTKEAISHALRLPPTLIAQALEFLVSSGLAEFKNGRFFSGKVSLHLSPRSPWVAKHHASWRMQSIQAIERQPDDQRDLHYTSVISACEKDIPRVRTILVDAIEKVRAVVKESPEEGLYCYTLDLFQV